MKKLFLTLGLALVTAFGASAQVFQFLPALNVRALGITNGAGFTNGLPYFGGSALLLTNTTGLQYTNNSGTYVIVPSTNVTSGFISVSNGVGFFTNDTSPLALDIPWHADRSGNLTTNFNLAYAAAFNATSTGAVVTVWAPIITGPLSGASGVNPAVAPFGNSGPGTILDLAHLLTVPLPVFAGGSTSGVVAVNFSPYPGIKGFRLISAGLTNTAGQAWLYQLGSGTYVP